MFEYDSEKMDTIMSNMKTIGNNLNDDFSGIDEIIKSVGNSWEGEASSAYVSDASKIISTYPSYVDTLDECVQYIKDSNSSKVEAEKKNENLISKLFGF